MFFPPLELATTVLSVCSFITETSAYFDMGTTTAAYVEEKEDTPRQSFFKWQRTEFSGLELWYGHWDWDELHQRRKLCYIAGVSIDFLPIGVATILNKRTLITSDNMLDMHMDRQRDLRIWALGLQGLHTTPYRYRVWRVRRLYPRSMNPEHWHGIRGFHQPRHDIAIIHTLDKMYLYSSMPERWLHAYKSDLAGKHELLREDLWFAGSGFRDMQHIYENYEITYALIKRSFVVDCSIYLPKYWGKFICIKNMDSLPGVPNGGGMFMMDKLTALGCFEIRYNDDRIFAFTDLRYYIDWIQFSAQIEPGEYYEYAYPQWGQRTFWTYDKKFNYPYIPKWEISDDLYPLGKRK